MFTDQDRLMSGRLALDSITAQDVVIVFLVVFVLAGVGFYFKGVWGAVWGVALGILGYLFWTQIPIF